MKKFHSMALIAASTAFLGLGGGVAMAQTVSGSDPYQQGFAAGAAAQQQNNINAFNNGVQAGQAQQDATTQAYTNGFAAGQAQTKTDTDQAYNSGYHDKAVEENDSNNRAFDNGFRMGANQLADLDADFP